MDIKTLRLVNLVVHFFLAVSNSLIAFLALFCRADSFASISAFSWSLAAGVSRWL